MKILFLGNSQLACLKATFDDDPSHFDGHEVSWLVTVGGSGPFLQIEGGSFKVMEGSLHPDYPARAFPAEAAHLPAEHYDAIVVSALGYVDGGFRHKTPAQRSGLLYPYKPKQNSVTDRHLSVECYRRLVLNCMQEQPGFALLAGLRTTFSGRLIVQPFPMISAFIKEHPEWPLNLMYEDPLGAHRFFSDIRDAFVARACAEAGAELLAYPDAACEDGLFTRAEFMAAPDVLHPRKEYGRLVFRQILDAL